ncbi:34473_t:CDS:2, partial [Racocetra persica]
QRINITDEGNKVAKYFIPHNGKSVTKIRIDDEQQLKHEYMISQDDVDINYDKCPELYQYCEYPILFAVSDNKLVLMQIFGNDESVVKKI